MKLPRSTNHVPRIEMLPLIDIVFLVLVVFIYAMLSMVIHRGITLDLPVASTSQIDPKDYLSVSVTKEGLVYFNKNQCSMSELEFLLAANKKNSLESLPLYINADTQARHGLVVSVIDIARKSGIKQVVIEAKEKEL